MTQAAKTHPETIFVLSENGHGKMRYYRQVNELVKAIGMGHGVVSYDYRRGGILKHFEFGRATVMFLDRAGLDITHIVEPIAHELWTYDRTHGAAYNYNDKFLGRQRDDQKERARAAFFKAKREELSKILRDELGL